MAMAAFGTVGAIWRNFVLTAFRDDAALKPEELTAWFVASGWDELAASGVDQTVLH